MKYNIITPYKASDLTGKKAKFGINETNLFIENIFKRSLKLIDICEFAYLPLIIEIFK